MCKINIYDILYIINIKPPFLNVLATDVKSSSKMGGQLRKSLT